MQPHRLATAVSAAGILVIGFLAWITDVRAQPEACGAMECWEKEVEGGPNQYSHDGGMPPTGEGWRIIHTHSSTGGYQNWHDWNGTQIMEDVHNHFNCCPPGGC
jgi:hypothetical protein